MRVSISCYLSLLGPPSQSLLTLSDLFQSTSTASNQSVAGPSSISPLPPHLQWKRKHNLIHTKAITHKSSRKSSHQPYDGKENKNAASIATSPRSPKRIYHQAPFHFASLNEGLNRFPNPTQLHPCPLFRRSHIPRPRTDSPARPHPTDFLPRCRDRRPGVLSKRRSP